MHATAGRLRMRPHRCVPPDWQTRSLDAGSEQIAIDAWSADCWRSLKAKSSCSAAVRWVPPRVPAPTVPDRPGLSAVVDLAVSIFSTVSAALPRYWPDQFVIAARRPASCRAGCRAAAPVGRASKSLRTAGGARATRSCGHQGRSIGILEPRRATQGTLTWLEAPRRESRRSERPGWAGRNRDLAGHVPLPGRRKKKVHRDTSRVDRIIQ